MYRCGQRGRRGGREVVHGDAEGASKDPDGELFWAAEDFERDGPGRRGGRDARAVGVRCIKAVQAVADEDVARSQADSCGLIIGFDGGDEDAARGEERRVSGPGFGSLFERGEGREALGERVDRVGHLEAAVEGEGFGPALAGGGGVAFVTLDESKPLEAAGLVLDMRDGARALQG